MSVPVHNLYDFIHHLTEKKMWLLYFFPWGCKNLTNLTDYIINEEMLNGPSGIPIENRIAENLLPPEYHNIQWVKSTQPILLCHDQEPLNYDLYLDGSDYIHEIKEWLDDRNTPNSPKNSNFNLRSKSSDSFQKTWILLHSEINSSQLEKYESTGRFIGAYWWSHAIIARDWYRFAEHDTRLLDLQKDQSLFLIYCRDSTGSRQYRSRFLSGLDPQVRSKSQIGSFESKKISSESSAEYHYQDFIRSKISVVLETIFEDNRIHFTEKTLRPIACGHPFILAAGHNSLELLRSYGFKTFSPWINESYDKIENPESRLIAIHQEMARLSSLDDVSLGHLIDQCRVIAQYNKQVFFSNEFFQQVSTELKTNVKIALEKTKNSLDPVPWMNNYLWNRREIIDVQLPGNLKRIVNDLLEQNHRHQHSLDDKSGADGNDV